MVTLEVLNLSPNLIKDLEAEIKKKLNIQHVVSNSFDVKIKITAICYDVTVEGVCHDTKNSE